jgi:hypothetical protein
MNVCLYWGCGGVETALPKIGVDVLYVLGLG